MSFFLSSNGSDTINGTSGNDTIRVLGGGGLFNGLEGDDSISFQGYGTANGGFGDDTIEIDRNQATEGRTIVDAGPGNDFILDRTSGPSRSVNADGSFVGDTISGGLGNDSIIVTSRLGFQLVFGGDGDDTLAAAFATTEAVLTGGPGADVFQINLEDDHNRFRTIVITDFDLSEDSISRIRVSVMIKRFSASIFFRF